MSIVSLSIVRNEADIIEAFVRHHARFIDHMLIVDHRSCDGTVEILEKLCGEGLAITVLSEDSPAYRQRETLDSLFYEIALREKPDWIVPLDADEFMTVEGEDIRRAIEALPKDVITLLPWRSYIPQPEGLDHEPNILRRMTHRVHSLENPFCKVLIPAGFHGRGYALGLGNHSVLEVSSQTACPALRSASLALAHFPIRSAAQIMTKAFVGWVSHQHNPDKQPGQNFHWQFLHDEFLREGPPSPKRLAELALRYPSFAEEPVNAEIVGDPLPTVDLLYTKGFSLDPHSMLRRTEAEIAAAVSA